MYRCTECQEEYAEKPDYCQCGNDEFELVANNSGTPPAPAANNIKNEFKKNIPLNTILSVSFFVLCIILSISVWFIKVKTPEKTTAAQPAKEQSTNIPSDVEGFWNDKQAAAPVSKEKTQPETSQKPAQTTSAKPVQKQTSSSQKTTSKSTPAQQKPAASTTAKSSQSTKPAASKPQKPAAGQTSSTPAQTTASKPSQQTTSSTQSKPVQTPKLPESVLNINKPAQSTAQTQTKPQTQVQTQAQPSKPPQMSQSEFLEYKGAIRGALLAKLNVAAIQGTGDCAVEFSLDSTGKLVNRNFIYKSSNKTVNDEVYLMLMRLPYYKQPPKYYNGEKIKLKFYFNNGYYEITFI